MKLHLKKLVAKPIAKRIIEAYEELGYKIIVDEKEWEDYTQYMKFSYETKGGCTLAFGIPKEEFEEKKPLKPYVWYPVEEFDGNPNNYILLERDDSGGYTAYDLAINELSERTTHFMYIEYMKEI